MKTKYFILPVIFMLSNIAIGQSILLQVVSSLGNSDNIGQLHWTIGETVIGGDKQLPQGFHQGNLIITSINDLTDDYKIIAYPNPSKNGFYIKSEKMDKFSIVLYNVHGKILTKKTKTQLPVFIDISGYYSGIYFVQISNNLLIVKTFKIEKIK